MTTTENWLPIPGYEGLYSVSDQGRVRSESRTVNYRDRRAKTVISRHRKQQLLSPLFAGGYLRVSLYLNKKPTQHSIHVLVLTAFMGPRPDGHEALHGNDDRFDNALSNLRWGTSSQNKFDAIANGRNRNVNKTHCKYGHEFTEENTRLRKRDSGSETRECRACGREKQRNRRSA